MSLQILKVFLRLGCTSFGGPMAHLEYFRRELVERRKWCSEESYAEIVAVAQSLPGPASSQVAFALGLLRGGWLGALAAWIGFASPSAAVMMWFAFAEPSLHGRMGIAVVHGLQLSAVAVVAQAILVMGKHLTPDWQRLLIALAAAAIATYTVASVSTVLAIAFGAFCGVIFLPADSAPNLPLFDLHRRAGMIAGGVYLALLGASLLIRGRRPGVLQISSAFYRSGALVFGGGHVVLPLLEHAVVSPGWVSQPVFLTGYGFAQSIPGPLFTFAAFLGVAIQSQASPICSGLVALMAIFLPGMLAMAAALSFWSSVREVRLFHKALAGINASVVGVLAAVFLRPVCSTALVSALDGLIAAGCLAMLALGKAPPFAVVLTATLASVLIMR